MTKQSIWGRDFTMVVLGQIISLFGNAILRFALPLYLLDQTGSPALFGLVSACSFIPMILLSPIGGIIADRVNKRNIMVALDFSTAGLIVLFMLALGKISLVPLLIATLMLLYGISGAYQPAVQASLPALVDTEQLLPANAVINQVNSLASLLGPVIGGLLYTAWGLTPILLIGTACFFCSAVMEIFIHIPFVKQKGGESVLAIVREDLSVSFRFLRHDRPVLFRIVLLICAINLFLSALFIIGVPVLVKQTMGLGSEFYGFAMGAMAAGGLTGGILSGVFAKKLHIYRAHILLVICAAGLVPIGLSLLLPQAMASYAVLVVISFAQMVMSTMFSIQMLAYVQQETPQELIGKVISCLLALSMCAQPLGQVMYGALFERFAAYPWAIMLGGAAASLSIALAAKKTFAALKSEKAVDSNEE